MGEKFLSSPKHPDRLWGPDFILLIGYWGSFLEVNSPGRDFDHSLPFIDEFKNEWSCTSIPPLSLHGMGRENYTC